MLISTRVNEAQSILVFLVFVSMAALVILEAGVVQGRDVNPMVGQVKAEKCSFKISQLMN